MANFFSFALIGAILILKDPVTCSTHFSSWPYPRNRVEKSVSTREQPGSSDFEIPTHSETGQGLRKIVTARDYKGVKGGGQPTRTSASALDVNRNKYPRVKNYETEDYDLDLDFDQPTFSLHPPFVKEHLVTSHIRPFWSSQRLAENSRGQDGKIITKAGPSSIVNIYIVTAENGKMVPQVEVPSDRKYNTFRVPIVNTPTTTSTPSTTSPSPPYNPFLPVPKKSATKENVEDRSPSRSESGLLDTRKLHAYPTLLDFSNKVLHPPPARRTNQVKGPDIEDIITFN